MQKERIARRPRGSGSIFEHNGDYYGKWRIGGRQVKRKLGPVKTRTRPGLTGAQAEAVLREQMGSVTDADLPSPISATDGRTIEALGSLYIDHRRDVKGIKASTLEQYEAGLRVHLVPFFGSRPVPQIDAHLIERFTTHMHAKKAQGKRGGKQLSPKTVANQIGLLAALLNFAVRRKWVAVSPMLGVDIPRVRNADDVIQRLRFLDTSEVAALIAAALPGAYQPLDRALYTLAAFSGLRQGELLGLLWQAVDFEAGSIHVLEGLTKGRRSSPKGRRKRVVPLAPSAAQALLELRAISHWTAPTEPVFACPSTGEPMSRTQMMERYRSALKGARLPEAFTFHELRHTFGTTMARAGVSVGMIQSWLGHADLATTQIYMHYAPHGRDGGVIEAAFAFEADEMGQAA
jgi:integrase